MSNPFNQRTKTFGQSPVTGGVRRRSGAAEAKEDAQFWWDWSDNSVTFQDALGTIPCTNLTLCKRLNNKGTVAFDAIEDGTGVPSILFNALNGFQSNTYFGAGSISAGVPPVGQHTEGSTFMSVGRRTGIEGSTWSLGGFTWNGGGQINFQLYPGVFPGDPGGSIRGNFSGSGFFDLKVGGVNNDWHWVWATMESNGDWRMRVSGETERNGNSAYAGIGGNNIFVGNSGSDILEQVLWDKVISDAAIAGHIADFEAKYGGAFPIP